MRPHARNGVVPFRRLIHALRAAGYSITMRRYVVDRGASFVRFEGHGVLGWFGENHPALARDRFRHRVVADNIKTFNKLWQCPCIMSLDRTPEEIIQYLKVLGTQRGRELAVGSCGYSTDNPWPYDYKE